MQLSQNSRLATLSHPIAWHVLMLAGLLAATPGCGLLFGGGSPSDANIKLRKEKQSLTTEVTQLKAKQSADAEVIKGLRDSKPTVPTLPADRLSRLFTTHGLKLGRLTGGWDRDPHHAGAEGVVVHIVPVDDYGSAIKAAGGFTVELFDLDSPNHALAGKWQFDVTEVPKYWRDSLFDYSYVLECPWKDELPKHANLTVKVTFLDELTQVKFEVQQPIVIELPQPQTKPASGPATIPATAPTSAPSSLPATSKNAGF